MSLKTKTITNITLFFFLTVTQIEKMVGAREQKESYDRLGLRNQFVLYDGNNDAEPETFRTEYFFFQKLDTRAVTRE